jgi:hypothetical protein
MNFGIDDEVDDLPSACDGTSAIDKYFEEVDAVRDRITMRQTLAPLYDQMINLRVHITDDLLRDEFDSIVKQQLSYIEKNFSRLEFINALRQMLVLIAKAIER